MSQAPANIISVDQWIDDVLGKAKYNSPAAQACAYAHTSNIGLSKYWGKREVSFNLPVTGSVSISLSQRGTKTSLSLIDAPQHQVIPNGEETDAGQALQLRLASS
jgi:mevalonate pyrophosphate decarboxylase